MADTSISLLERAARDADADSWQRISDIYTPLLGGWLRGQGLQPSDTDDVVQEVLLYVSTQLPRFRHSGRTGAFRTWLRRILVNRLRKLRRSERGRRTAVGDGGILDRLEELADPAGGLSRMWDREHDRHVASELMRLVRMKVSETTWEAFRQTVLDGDPPSVVAGRLGLSPNAVCAARARVLHQMRRDGRGLID